MEITIDLLNVTFSCQKKILYLISYFTDLFSYGLMTDLATPTTLNMLYITCSYNLALALKWADERFGDMLT